MTRHDDPHTPDESPDERATVSLAGFEELPARVRDHLSSRRKFLSNSAMVGGGALALSATNSGVATAQADDDDDDDEDDEPEGFSAEAIAPHATFTDDVGAAFAVQYDDADDDVGFLLDASTVVIAKVTWEPGGTSGWHTHPGPVIVSVVEGEIDVVFEDECVRHSYAAGDAFVDTGGHAEVAENASAGEPAVVYAVFLGVPDGEPPTNWVEAREC